MYLIDLASVLGVASCTGLDGRFTGGVFWAFAVQQPLTVHAQQAGDFFQARVGHAAQVPVVYVLGLDLAEDRKLGRGNAHFFQQCLEARAAMMFFHKHGVYRPMWRG
ncbi:hypothetical protein D3C71_1745140 [compost metagenome]